MATHTFDEEEIVNLGYILSHPTRLRIIKVLKESDPAERPEGLYIAEIARRLGDLNPKLVSFHLSMLAQYGFVESHFGLANPGNAPVAVKYYKTTPKLDDILSKYGEIITKVERA